MTYNVFGGTLSLTQSISTMQLSLVLAAMLVTTWLTHSRWLAIPVLTGTYVQQPVS